MKYVNYSKWLHSDSIFKIFKNITYDWSGITRTVIIIAAETAPNNTTVMIDIIVLVVRPKQVVSFATIVTDSIHKPIWLVNKICIDKFDIVVLDICFLIYGIY